MKLAEWLDDLTVRFLINGPISELSSVSRICFQLEEAQWYYEDFIRPSEAAKGNFLPHMSLQDFCLAMMKTCPYTAMFSTEQHLAAYQNFLEYKVRIPVRGAILLDSSMEHAVLVKGYKKGANWSFPRGKINQEEDDLECAIREVYEETGFHIREAGLIKESDPPQAIDVNLRDQNIELFVFNDVPLDTQFETRTRKEISKIEWFRLRDLPGYAKKGKTPNYDSEHGVPQANKFYMVAPFLPPLKRWIANRKRAQQSAPNGSLSIPLLTDMPAGAETDDGLATDATESNEKRSQQLRQLLNIGSTAPIPMPLTTENLQTLEYKNEKVGQNSHNFDQQQWQPMHPMQSGMQMYYQGLPNLSRQPLSQDPYASMAAYPHGPTQFGPTSNGYNLQTQGSMHGHAAVDPRNALVSQMQSAPQQLMFPTDRRQVDDDRLLPREALPPQATRYEASAHPFHEETTQRAPQAEELPAPKLNPHAMRLLETFRQSKPIQGETAPSQPAAQQNAHQARLLDLFKSPTQKPVPTVVNKDPEVNTPTELAVVKGEVPAGKPKTTLSQYTRTLPAKSQTAVQRTVPAQPVVAEVDLALKAITNAMQAQPELSTRSGKHVANGAAKVTHDRKDGGHHRTRQASHSPKPVQKGKGKSTQEAPKTPSFTILARPESAKETSTAIFPPQILKRPDAHAGETAEIPATGNTAAQNHLLALFGKGKSTSDTTTSATLKVTQGESSKSLDFKQPITILRHASPVVQVQPPMPDAPQLVPEVKPSKIATTPRNDLLDLFKRGNDTVMSPETPISPFVLGSPNVPRQHVSSFGSPGKAPVDKRPELTVERKASNSATPTEAKGFLLGFLNDVVQKESRAT